MYWNEHAPPHFHVRYKDFQITINIDDGIVKGEFPPRALKLVLEWYEIVDERLGL